MTFTAPHRTPTELRNSAVSFVKRHLTLLLAALIVSLLCTPARLQASEKKSAATATERSLANADLLIEQLIMQIDTDPTELADNPNPTSLVSSIPNIKPVNGSITSLFGMRVHPIYNLSLFHQGIDIATSEGTRVQTTGDGIVAFSGYDSGYGQRVTINHGYGYKTTYAHLSKVLVRQGQKVNRGDIIALSGNSGVSTGPHLHYEVQKENVKVNPMNYFFTGENPEKFITIQHPSPEQSDNHS